MLQISDSGCPSSNKEIGCRIGIWDLILSCPDMGHPISVANAKAESRGKKLTQI